MLPDDTEIQFLPTQDSSPRARYALVSDEALDRRQIFLVDDIVEETFEQIKNLYDSLIENNPDEPIHFIVGTAGGDVRAMLGIMNLIILSKTPCYTYILGETCSAGSWIYLCGHKRFAPKTGLVSFMLHPMAWSRDDNSGNHESHITYVNKLCNQLVEFTSSRTNIDKDTLKRLAKTETEYFVGDELFDCGISTDELTTSAFFVRPKIETPKKKSRKKTEVVLLEG